MAATWGRPASARRLLRRRARLGGGCAFVDALAAADAQVAARAETEAAASAEAGPGSEAAEPPLKAPMTNAADADEVRDLVDELRRFMDD